MISRRPTYLLLAVMGLGIGLCCPTDVQAAPPQFNATLKVTTTSLSPFPAPDRKFLFALTLDEYFPLVKLAPGKEYEFSYNPKDTLLTYTRNYRKNQGLIPVSSDVQAFVDRRVELNLKSMSSDINRTSLMKDQQNKAGGLFNIQIPIRSKTFESLFGEGGAGLKVSGYRKITFSGRSTWTDGQSSVYAQQSKFPSLNMEQVYRFDINGTIGSKISVSVSQDSRNDLPLANRLILRYKGNEDDVLQTIEAGNTTLDLPSTQFLKYSTRVQGLFGIKATAKIADLTITTIASQEKGSTEAVEITAGSASSSKRVLRDVEYRRRTIFDLGRIARDSTYWPLSDTLPKPGIDEFDYYAGDSIMLAILYQDDKPYNAIDRAGRPAGICYVDPRDTLRADPTNLYTEAGNFEKIDQASYYVNPTSFYVVFTEQVLGDDDILGAFIVVRRADRSIDTIGNISGDTLRLKLIKPTSYSRINHHVWEYEWRNVYLLSSASLDPSGLEVDVFRGSTINYNQEADPNALNYQSGNGVKYLQLLGLDRYDASNARIPDGEIDKNSNVIDASLGLLIFPDRHPFDSRLLYAIGTNGDTVRLAETVPEIYTQTTESITRAASKYYLSIATKERGNSVIDLQSTNIIEGSEIVTYNGATLKKGEDYDINYDMGRLTLLKDEYTDINSSLSVMFETAPFFSLTRKTLLGTRLEYAPNKNFKVGGTLLYKSDKATNRKPKVGEETSKMMVWDADFSYGFEAKPLTALVNAIPFFTTQAASNIKINAEVAQSRPEPNVDGSAYVDDFEGSDESYSLGIRRGDWRHCSRPEVVDTSLQFARGHVSWDTRDNYTNKEIWNRDEGQGTADIARVLVVYYKPDTAKYVPTADNTIDTIPVEAESTWNGFMKDIPSGIATQLENSQLLEMRLRGEAGIIHIDLGRISDDINGNGVADSEDENSNRTLEDEEDKGLDGLPDDQEPGYHVTANPDPNGDNYDENNIWKVNGTQGNRVDVTFGGSRPDMENPDYNAFNKNNDYYSFRVDLSDTTQFYVPGTRNDAGWRTIRIPLRDVTALDTVIGEPSWKEITFARIWFDSASTMRLNDPIKIEFASIDMVSNTWSDSLWVTDSLRGGVATFDVAVINDEIDSRYQSPSGVEGYYDVTRDVTEKEQSLLLRYENLKGRVLINTGSEIGFAADTALAVRKFYRANNYMGYGKLEAFVHGPSTARDDSLMFFLRMGTDKTAYYEFRTLLDTGWAASNHVVIDFNEITGLKAKLLARRADGDTALSIVDSTGHYAVAIKASGQDPTLTRIQYFSMGIVNLDPNTPATGEVWVDELRLTDVRDDMGMAAQVNLSGNMADLITFATGYSTQDAYYRGISASTKGGASDNLGSGQTRTSYSFSGGIQLHRLFPRSLQLSLPLSFNWSQSVQSPLLRSNTDIVVPEELKKDETSVSVSKGFQIREKIQKNTKNIIFAVLLNRLTSSFSYNISKGHSATQPKYMREGYNATANYTLGMKTIPAISPLSWTKFLKKPFDLSKTKIYLYPTQLDFSGTLAGSYSKSLNLDGANPTSIKQDFTGSVAIGYKLFDNLTSSLTLNTVRDLKDPKTVNVTFNPKQFRLGIEQRSDQSFRASYSPTLFKFLTHSVEYSARYSDQFKVNTDSSTSHQAGVNTNTNFTFSLKHQSLLGTNKGGGLKKKAQKGRSGITTLFMMPIKGVRYITDAIKPVTVKYGITESSMFPALTEKATLAYRFGFTNDPGVPRTTATGVNRQAHAIGRTVSAGSGAALFSGISADVRYERTMQKTLDTSPTERVSETWPDVTFNLRSIRGLWLLGKLLSSISPSSGFSRNIEYNQRLAAGFRSDEKVRKAFSPLLGFSINVSKAIRTNGRLEVSTTTTTRYTETTGALSGITRSTSKGVSFDGSYNFRSPSGIKLPLFGRVKFESVMSLSLNVSYRLTNDETGEAANDFKLESFSRKTSLNVQPGASYSFSSTIKGGLSGRWQDNYDSSTRRRTHTRELGIWVEMNF